MYADPYLKKTSFYLAFYYFLGYNKTKNILINKNYAI